MGVEVFESCMIELRTFKSRPSDACLCQRSMLEVSALAIGSTQIGAGKISMCQLRTAKVGISQIGANQ